MPHPLALRVLFRLADIVRQIDLRSPTPVEEPSESIEDTSQAPDLDTASVVRSLHPYYRSSRKASTRPLRGIDGDKH